MCYCVLLACKSGFSGCGFLLTGPGLLGRLLEWYEQMRGTFGLEDHLLDLATNFLDRAVSSRSVTADEFRRNAVAALYVSSKLEGSASFKAADVPVLTQY